VQLGGKRENAGERMMRLLKKEATQTSKYLAQIGKEIEACISENQSCHEKMERLCQVKGVGRVVAASVLAFLPELGTLPERTISALAGLAPYPNQSGPLERPRRIWGGRREVRLALYPAAMVAVRYNPVLKVFNQRLKDKGKPGLVRMVAVMRKLICLLNKICAQPNFSPLT
jgi:transposase